LYYYANLLSFIQLEHIKSVFLTFYGTNYQLQKFISKKLIIRN